MTKNRYNVAGHLLDIRLADAALVDADILPSFKPFVSEEEGKLLLSLDARLGTPIDFSDWEEIGQFDCGGANHGVYRKGSEAFDYGFRISLPDVQGGELSCCLVARKQFQECEAVLVAGQPTWQFGLNNAIMLAYAFAAADKQTLLVHASVIRNDGWGYLFTAPSGTGKSTHTHLWYKHIPGSDLMNDDNPVVRIVDGQGIVYGSPWSGKTPCYRNIKAPIGGITRLEQAPYNKIERMAPVPAFAALLPAVSSMKWDTYIYMSICKTVGELIQAVPIYHLDCLPDKEAARVSYAKMRGPTPAIPRGRDRESPTPTLRELGCLNN